MPDEARDGAARLFRDRAGDLAALVALARDPDLHELVIAERAIERRDHARRDAGRADLHHGIERVREAAQVPAITAGELDARVAARGSRQARSLRSRRSQLGTKERGPPLLVGARQGAGLYGAVVFRKGMRTLVFESSDHTTVAAEARRDWHWSSHRTLRGPPSRRPLALGFACTILPSSPLPGATLGLCKGPGVLQKSEIGRVHSSPIWGRLGSNRPRSARRGGRK